MKPTLELAVQVASQQPFTQLLGAEVTSYGEGRAEFSLRLTPMHLQQHGFVHGGVIGYMADNTLTFAGGSVLGPAIVTSEYKMSYVRPGRGEALVCRAQVVHAGKRQAVVECRVYSVSAGVESLCAVALGTVSRLSDPDSST